MNVTFKELADQMPGLLKSLESQPFRTMENLVDIPKQGIYVLYENDKPLYVGRSNRLKARLREHYQESSTHTSATFAFNLAKEEMELSQGIPVRITRKELEQDPVFDTTFSKARKRVSKMKIRVVQVDNQVTQALFEIYAALALKAPYNKFSTH